MFIADKTQSIGTFIQVIARYKQRNCVRSTFKAKASFTWRQI